MDPTMVETREERMQQRLRGAQRRQVKDVDFGLTFLSAPAQSQQVAVTQELPVPELPAQLSSQTPGSGKGRGRPKAIAVDENSRSITHNVNDANTSAKRRKLPSKEPSPPSSSSRNTRSSTHTPRPDIYDLPEDESNEVVNAEVANSSMIQAIEHKAVDEAEMVAPILQSNNTGTRSSQALEQEDNMHLNIDALGSGLHSREASNEATELRAELQDHIHDTNPDSVQTPFTSSPMIGRKRKMGEASQEKQHSSEKRQRISRTARERLNTHDHVKGKSPKGVRDLRRQSIPKTSPEIEDEADDNSIAEAEEIDDQEAAAVLNKNRTRRVSRNAIGPATQISPIVRKKKPSKPPRPLTPEQQQPRKRQKAVSNTGIASKQPKKSRKQNARLGSPIPVTVHRMSEKLYYEDNEVDAEILNSEIPYIKKGGVNAIDVLRQICEETITSSLDMLHDLRANSDDSALRREYNTKWRAVESFGNELQTRLIEHTINLDNTFALEKRVRDEQKRKLALREEILRVRAEREQIALRMDDIRIRHEFETEDARKRDTLNINIHDIEMAIELGKANAGNNGQTQMSGIELILKRVASEVSNKSNTGGMLKQMKDFNGFLERTALALETRKT